VDQILAAFETTVLNSGQSFQWEGIRISSDECLSFALSIALPKWRIFIDSRLQ